MTRQRVAFQNNRVADSFRAFAVGELAVQLNSLFFGELLLLGIPITAGLWFFGRTEGEPIYMRRVLLLTGMILVVIFLFFVIPLGFDSVAGTMTAFAIAVTIGMAIWACNRYVWLPRRRKSINITDKVNEFADLNARGIISDEVFEKLKKLYRLP